MKSNFIVSGNDPRSKAVVHETKLNSEIYQHTFLLSSVSSDKLSL